MCQIEDGYFTYDGGVFQLLLGVKLIVLEKDAGLPYLVFEGFCQSAKSFAACIVITIEFRVLT